MHSIRIRLAGCSWFWLLATFFLWPGFASAQRNRQALEKEKKQNLEKMAQIRTILKETASQKQVSLGQLQALNQQIKAQSNQINLLTEDVKLTESEIDELRQASTVLINDLKKLKDEYAEMVYAAERRRQQVNPLGFLFSADNFNQLVARYRYLRQYSDARQSQKRELEKVQGMLQNKRVATERKRKQQKTTLTVKVEETRKLEGLQKEQNEVVQVLGQKEADLAKELAESRRAVSRMELLITSLIRREARERAERARIERERLARVEAARKAAYDRRRADALAAAEAAEKAGKPAPAPLPEPEPEPKKLDERRTNNLNEAEGALASSFTASRARLPWPVQHGFISDRFGVKPHPVLRGIKVDNMGIDIQTNAGESVRAVYEGVVVDVETMPLYNTVVAIQHGDYMTVYAKLKNSSVRIGQHVKARDNVGTVATNKDGVSELQFQVWKDATRLNPASWLVPR